MMEMSSQTVINFVTEYNSNNFREPQKSEFVKSYKNNEQIFAKTWDTWCKTLESASEEREELKFLRDTVTPVLMELDQVHRSYGFRVDKAMKLYVLNYPGDYKDAVADQLEMKILPKLNGIELADSHFGRIKGAMQKAIENTGDEKLAKAFDDACSQDGTFFKWRGVMR